MKHCAFLIIKNKSKSKPSVIIDTYIPPLANIGSWLSLLPEKIISAHPYLKLKIHFKKYFEQENTLSCGLYL